MPVYALVRYEIRPEARADAERAMHDFASYVRAQLPGSTWTVYRDPDAPARYVALVRDDDAKADALRRAAAGTRAFEAALAPLLVAPPEIMGCELVTSSDLQRRFKPPRRS